jgi:hypothetical protein
VVVGGRAGEQILVETLLNGNPVRRSEGTLDPSGFTVFGFSAELAARPGHKLLRVSSTSLGAQEAALHADGTFDDAPPRRAPVQIPRSVRGAHRLAA